MGVVLDQVEEQTGYTEERKKKLKASRPRDLDWFDWLFFHPTGYKMSVVAVYGALALLAALPLFFFKSWILLAVYFVAVIYFVYQAIKYLKVDNTLYEFYGGRIG